MLTRIRVNSYRGAKYVAICYADRHRDTGIKASFVNAGDSYDNAVAGTANGLHKAGLIRAKPA